MAALSKENRNYRYMLTGGSLKTIRSTQPETFLAINSHLKGTTWAFSLQIYSANNNTKIPEAEGRSKVRGGLFTSVMNGS